ncbi:MAG: NifB/NifX family molybdenum-iron cluster-binding protein, partial [Parasulfuritortus sp.]|nr:NifB/NifX family molybdenum-iron cluster-binding protein [Parasulfuritortus sp.]
PPSPQPSATEAPGLRVAVASNYGEAMNGSFSTCARFLIYRLNPADLSLIDIRNPADGGRKNERDRQRAELLTDCHLLCACALGNLAAARLMGTGIHPLQLACNDNARDALRPIQDVLASAPPPWMARAMAMRNGGEC